jgi:leucyl-tRNA synthetase
MLVVQVNGKLRDRIAVPASIIEDELSQILQEKATKANSYLKGKKVLKRVYVPGRLVNFVVQQADI